LGIVTLIRLVQPPNAASPILLTLLAMVTLVRVEAALNALRPMFVTPFGIM